MDYSLVQQWYFFNIIELARHYANVSYDDHNYKWILVNDFPLPNTFIQNSSPLMIRTPGSNIDAFNDYHFYMNKKLERFDGKHEIHLFDEEGYNDLADNGFARLSFHLHSFRPTLPIHNGDNMIDVCRSLYNFLGARWDS